MSRPTPRCRGAFSLLELLLAVALSIALAALLGFAIDLHLVRLDASRSTVSQAQLARTVLARIAADLRAATTAPTQDVSEAMAAAEAAARFNVDEVDETTPPETAEPSVASEAERPPGLYGAIESLAIDVPHVWQAVTTTDLGATPTARLDAGWSRVTYAMSADPGTPGLVRTETPRDMQRWLDEQGQAPPAPSPLAPEVTALRFRYFDGAELVEVWDTTEAESLPLAVEVQIEVLPADEIDAPHASAERKRNKVYRRFVRLPAAADETPPEEVAAGASSAGAEGP